MAANPRIDDLRKRLERDPQSRLFAQLAEELRKDGDLADAIRVAREGLGRHPNYPSARMTLGRALMDTGDTRGAQRELETVVNGAPDNILAGRLLAECLEAEGALDAALARFRTTLALSPGDRQLAAQVESLEQRLRAKVVAPVDPRAFEPETSSTSPVPLTAVDEDMEMELEPAYERPSSLVVRPLPDEDVFDAGAADAVAPIPLVEVSEEFELERPYDALAARAAASSPSPAAAPAPTPAPAAPPAPAVAPAPGAPGSDLNSSTLAELYFNQGFTDQAIDVYRQILDREPGNERVRARLRELEALQRHLHADEPAPAPPRPVPLDPEARARRRQALERTIAGLEGLQAALRRG